jgi:hypothetical protein
MPQGTDLFNSTKGQFSNYTTLIGGASPNADKWFYDDFASLGNVNVTSGSVVVSDIGGVETALAPTAKLAFEMNQDGYFDINGRWVHNAGYPKALSDFAVVLKYTTGTDVSGFSIGAYGRKNGSKYLAAKIANGKIQIVKADSGGEHVLNEYTNQTALALKAPGVYWLVFIAVGKTIRCEHWDSDPRMGGTPAVKIEYILSGSEFADYSSASRVGVIDWVPFRISSRVLNIEICNAFADNTSAISTVLDQKHVDIRDFINFTYPYKYKTLRELNNYHVAEYAYAQVITLTAKPTGGTFSLKFFPSDADPYVPIVIGPFNHNASDITILNALNSALNALPKFSNVRSQPIMIVANNLLDTTPTMTIEFNTDYGDISLLQMDLSSLTGASPIESEEKYDLNTHVGTFASAINDSFFVRDADPTSNKETVADLRIDYAKKNENWTLYSNGLSAPSPRKFKPSSLAVGKLITQQNRRAAVLNFSLAQGQYKNPASWSVYLHSAALPVNCLTIGTPTSADDLLIEVSFSSFPWNGTVPALSMDSPSGCSIQFTSQKNGLFSDQNGDSKYDSAVVPFYQNGSNKNIFYQNRGDSTVDFRANISKFLASGAGSLFTFSTVTGVRIYLKSNVWSNQSSIAIMAIRCVPASGKKWLSAEVNTLEQTVCAPNLDETELEFQIPPMIGGANVESVTGDISPIDSQQALIFQTGLDYSTNLNRFMMFAREQEYDDLSRSEWLTAEYAFNKSNALLRRFKTTRIRSKIENSDVDLFWDTHPGSIFQETYVDTNIPVKLCTESNFPSSPSVGDYVFTTDSDLYYRWNGSVWVLSPNPNPPNLDRLSLLEPENNYELSLIVDSNKMIVEIYRLTYAEQKTGRPVYISKTATSPEWKSIFGRIGWYAEFADKDTYVSSFNLESASYALLRTKPIISETPVEGGQLFTVDSGVKDFFTGFTSLRKEDTIVIDSQKVSGGSSTSSYAFQSYGTSELPGIVSNEFEIDDWNHMYIEFDIWVPRVLNTYDLRPKITLRPLEQPPATNGIDVFSGCVPETPLEIPFVPGAWSKYKFDLRGISDKNGKYFLEIFSDGGGDPSYSKHSSRWWIDNVHIYTQTVSWEMRAVKDGSWTPFRNNFNNKYGGLHLSERAVGNYVQLQARALTEEAWVAEYTLIPKYVSMGVFVKPQVSTVVGKGSIGTNDSLANVIICTSSTRPTSPYIGEIICETDTGKILRYAGSSTWVVVSNLQSLGRGASNGQTETTAALFDPSITASVVSGIMYYNPSDSTGPTVPSHDFFTPRTPIASLDQYVVAGVGKTSATFAVAGKYVDTKTVIGLTVLDWQDEE